MDDKKTNVFSYNFYRNELEQYIDRFCAIARGTDISILPYINDSKGKLSPSKTKAFIAELLRAGDVTGAERTEFYEAFLYCCIRSFVNGSMWVSMDMLDEPRRCCSFQDILDMARLAQQDVTAGLNESKEKMLYSEFSDYEGLPMIVQPVHSFITAMDQCYEWITDELFSTIESDRKLVDKIRLEVQDELYDVALDQFEGQQELDNEWAIAMGYGSYDEYEEELKDRAREAGFDDIAEYQWHLNEESMTEEEKLAAEIEEREQEEYFEYVEKINEQRRVLWEAFRDDFTNKKQYKEMYGKYRELFILLKENYIYATVEKMIYRFMYDNDLSVCCNSDAAQDEMMIVKDLNAQFSAFMRRNRRKYGLR